MLLKIISTGSQAGNCYALIADNGEILLLDFGCEANRILRGIEYRISDVCGTVLTHVHSDHSKAYKWLFQNGIPIYTNDETAEHFEIISGEKMIGKPERIPFKVGSFHVTGFYLPHTTRDKDTGALIPCPNFGYLIGHEEMGKLLYMTDMEYSPFSFKKQRVNHLVVEANYCGDMADNADANYYHRLQGHCSLDTCNGIVEANKTPDLRTVTLIHLSDSAADPDRMKSEIQQVVGKWVQVEVAEKGFQCELSKYPWGEV